jgi:hypothetical protein
MAEESTEPVAEAPVEPVQASAPIAAAPPELAPAADLRPFAVAGPKGTFHFRAVDAKSAANCYRNETGLPEDLMGRLTVTAAE